MKHHFFFLFLYLAVQGSGFSLSVFSHNQILKMGISVDYGVCKGKRKDGMACTAVINKYVWTSWSHVCRGT